MWTRSELKKKAKKRVSAHYWKCVLAAFVLSLAVGSTGAALGSNLGNFTSSFTSGLRAGQNAADFEDSMDELADDIEDAADEFEDAADELGDTADKLGDFADNPGDALDISAEGTFNVAMDGFFEGIEDGINDILIADEDTKEEINNAISELRDALDKSGITGISDSAKQTLISIIIALVIGYLIFVFVVWVVNVLFMVFIRNPFQLGSKKFFVDNHNEDINPSLGGLVISFKGHYANTVKIMFLRDLYETLWSLLFIIPGIIKSYEYMMVPYILAENPDIDSREAFRQSKALMTGNKWKAFVLTLSFIGWTLLDGLTCGILGIFYVNPYMAQTYAELYFALKEEHEGYAMLEGSVYENYKEVD